MKGKFLLISYIIIIPFISAAGLMCLLYFTEGKTRIVLSVMFYIYGLLRIFFGSIRLIHSVKVWGPNVKSWISRMKACDRKSILPIGALNSFIFTLSVIILILSIFVDVHWFPLVIVYFGISLDGNAVRNQPPYVLFLSASIDKASYRLHADLSKATRPFHQTHTLIKLDKAIKTFDYYSRQSNWRTYDEKNWGKVVHELIDLAKIIVLDARYITSATKDEAIRLFESKMLFKTVLVIEKDGTQPLIDSLDDKIKTAFQEVIKLPEDEVVGLVKDRAKNPVVHEAFD